MDSRISENDGKKPDQIVLWSRFFSGFCDLLFPAIETQSRSRGPPSVGIWRPTSFKPSMSSCGESARRDSNRLSVSALSARGTSTAVQVPLPFLFPMDQSLTRFIFPSLELDESKTVLFASLFLTPPNSDNLHQLPEVCHHIVFYLFRVYLAVYFFEELPRALYLCFFYFPQLQG